MIDREKLTVLLNNWTAYQEKVKSPEYVRTGSAIIQYQTYEEILRTLSKLLAVYEAADTVAEYSHDDQFLNLKKALAACSDEKTECCACCQDGNPGKCNTGVACPNHPEGAK